MKRTKDKSIQNKKISIITTFYNAQEFVLNAINSIFVQDIRFIPEGTQIEYVLVDDKSTDNSLEIVSKYIKDHNKDNFEWKLICPDKNLGCGGARKFGIDNATGDYFMFLDADDYYINTDFVKRAYETIVSENADIVEYGIVFNQPNGTQNVNCVRNKITCENPIHAQLLLFKDNAIKFNVWSKIYKADIVRSYKYSVSRTFEDVRTIPIWVSNAKKIVIMPTPEINYRAASGSIIREDMLKTRLGTITAISELFPIFKDNFQVLKAMYTRAMVDIDAVMTNHSSNDDGFNEMSRLNTKMLKYIYPDKWKELTYHIEDDKEVQEQLRQQNKLYEMAIQDIKKSKT